MNMRKTVAVLLLSVLLLCGCAKSRTVTNAEEARQRLGEFLDNFAYSITDEYDCKLMDTYTEQGKTVYELEAFWDDPDGETYSLGLFCVDADGNVTLSDSTPTE